MKIHRISSGLRFTCDRTMDGRVRDCNPYKVARSLRLGPNACVARRLALDEAVDLYLDHVKVERGLAAHTLDAYGRDLARAVAFLADRGRAEVDEVTALDLTD